MVTPIADITVKTATPIGNRAAIIVPKTMPRMISDNGPEINSALIRSSWILESKITSIAKSPVLQELNSESTFMSSQFSS